MVTIGFLGCGNMGAALAEAAAKTLGGDRLLLSNRTPEKARQLAQRLGAVAADNVQVAREARYLFLGVKPQMMAGLLTELAPVLAARQDRFVLVTMAAGLTTEAVTQMAGGAYPVIRIMPNTPASIGEGMILYTASSAVTDEELTAFCDAMSAAGRLDPLPESLMDAGSALSGCGPAFAYLFLEALADGGVACGLPRAKAQAYAAQTLRGAASMVLTTGEHPGILKDAVCSPSGTTIAGVRALEEGAFRAAAIQAVCAAYQRTLELKQ